MKEPWYEKSSDRERARQAMKILAAACGGAKFWEEDEGVPWDFKMIAIPHLYLVEVKIRTGLEYGQYDGVFMDESKYTKLRATEARVLFLIVTRDGRVCIARIDKMSQPEDLEAVRGGRRFPRHPAESKRKVVRIPWKWFHTVARVEPGQEPLLTDETPKSVRHAPQGRNGTADSKPDS